MRKAAQFVFLIGSGLALSACVSAYTDRGGSAETPLKDLVSIGGLSTTVPEAKDFVVESRTEKLDYIPVGVPNGGPQDRRKPLTPEELLLLQKKLEAAQKQNGATTTEE